MRSSLLDGSQDIAAVAASGNRNKDIARPSNSLQLTDKHLLVAIVITDGANGAITFDGNTLNQSKGVEAKAIDTNGAGDMFAGAFLYAITSGKGYAWAADLANDCAARVVAQFGPRLEASEFDAIRAKFGL